MTMALWDREFIEGGLVHQSESRLVVFITLSEGNPARSFADSGAALTQFVRGLNQVALHGERAGLPWVAVGELSPRNRRLHWHLLVAGLAYPWCSQAGAFGELLLRAKPDGTLAASGDLLRDPFGRLGVAVSKESTLKPLAIETGFGTGFLGMRQVRSEGRDWSNVGNYMGKYLSKGDAGSELPKGFQLVRASRARNAWWPGHSLTSVRAEHKRRLRDEGSSVRSFAPTPSTHERAGELDAGAAASDGQLSLVGPTVLEGGA